MQNQLRKFSPNTFFTTPTLQDSTILIHEGSNANKIWNTTTKVISHFIKLNCVFLKCFMNDNIPWGLKHIAIKITNNKYKLKVFTH